MEEGVAEYLLRVLGRECTCWKLRSDGGGGEDRCTGPSGSCGRGVEDRCTGPASNCGSGGEDRCTGPANSCGGEDRCTGLASSCGGGEDSVPGQPAAVVEVVRTDVPGQLAAVVVVRTGVPCQPAAVVVVVVRTGVPGQPAGVLSHRRSCVAHAHLPLPPGLCLWWLCLVLLLSRGVLG